MLDGKIFSALKKIIQNSHFKKKVSLEEQKAPKEDQLLRGRQIAFMIYDHFRAIGAHDTVLDYADFFPVTLRGDNVQEFDTRWDEVLLSVSKIPSDDILESLYKLRIRESEQLKTVLELYEMDIHQKISMPDCQKIGNDCEKKYRSETPITKHWRQTRESRNRSKGLKWRGKWKKGYVTSGKKKAFVRRETSAVSGMRVMIVHQNRPSEPSLTRGSCASRKRSVRGRSQTGRILRQPCRYYLKGTCTRSPCEYWHPPECQFYKNKSGCNTGDKCLFPHHKVDEQPNKKAEERLLFPQKKRKRRQDCCSNCENCKGNVSCTSYSRTFGYGILT